MAYADDAWSVVLRPPPVCFCRSTVRIRAESTCVCACASCESHLVRFFMAVIY